MSRHWSEVLGCSCGKTFRSYASEARHRHNFPMLCRPAKKPKASPTGRLSAGEPNVQNLPGSIADALDKAFERGLR